MYIIYPDRRVTAAALQDYGKLTSYTHVVLDMRGPGVTGFPTLRHPRAKCIPHPPAKYPEGFRYPAVHPPGIFAPPNKRKLAGYLLTVSSWIRHSANARASLKWSVNKYKVQACMSKATAQACCCTSAWMVLSYNASTSFIPTIACCARTSKP